MCIGRLTYYKGHDVLINALEQLNTEHIRAKIIGSGELQRGLQQRIEQKGLSERVHIYANMLTPELMQVIADADILVLPSIERTEAFGLVLLEAMRAAKPCICTDVKGSGMSEVVMQNKTGLVVPANDANALANAIATLAQSSQLREQLGRAGRQRFLTHFHIDTVANKVLALYADLLSNQ